jgi:IclR family pca regulon transcriptional regulator
VDSRRLSSTRVAAGAGGFGEIALTDEQLALGIRSIAAPLRDGSGKVIAGVNVNCHAAETPVERLLEHHLPLLLQTAGEISADFARLDAVPHVTVSAS